MLLLAGCVSVVGIAGREFRKEGDDNANPFHLKNQTASLTFGIGSNVEDPEINDPRNPRQAIS